MMHADTVVRNFVRPDGSVKHIVEFDPETGAYLCSHGGQGYQDGSAWSRGQGWGIYGFMISYIHTKKAEYLETAVKIADYCIAHIPENGLNPVDFCQPAEPAWEDSCGAVIIAGGLLQVADHVADAWKEKCHQAALRILHAIYEKRTDWSRGCDAIVQNCTGAYHDEEHHFPMNYADYYFIESIYKLRGTGIFVW